MTHRSPVPHKDMHVHNARTSYIYIPQSTPITELQSTYCKSYSGDLCSHVDFSQLNLLQLCEYAGYIGWPLKMRLQVDLMNREERTCMLKANPSVGKGFGSRNKTNQLNQYYRAKPVQML